MSNHKCITPVGQNEIMTVLIYDPIHGDVAVIVFIQWVYHYDCRWFMLLCCLMFWSEKESVFVMLSVTLQKVILMDMLGYYFKDFFFQMLRRELSECVGYDNSTVVLNLVLQQSTICYFIAPYVHAYFIRHSSCILHTFMHTSYVSMFIQCSK